MFTEKKRYKEALARVKHVRPFVSPNSGFLDQLRLFQEMKYEFDEKNQNYLEYIKLHPIDAGHLGHEGDDECREK